MKNKKTLTSEQLYKLNRRKSKICARLSPVVFWLFLVLSIVFFCMTVANSLGNVMEITAMLDKDTLTGEEITQNYLQLIEKYGEWVIMGGDGGAIVISFVDIRQALFSGLALTYGIISIMCLVLAVVLGKVVFKQLSRMYLNSNDIMVDMATLKTLQAVEGKNKATSKKEWF